MDKGDIICWLVINCVGLYFDKIVQLIMLEIDFQIFFFWGEYYELCLEKCYLVNNLIYLVFNFNFLFLGVYFIWMIGGGIEAGLNVVFVFWWEGYSCYDFDLAEFWEIFFYLGFQ